MLCLLNCVDYFIFIISCKIAQLIRSDTFVDDMRHNKPVFYKNSQTCDDRLVGNTERSTDFYRSKVYATTNILYHSGSKKSTIIPLFLHYFSLFRGTLKIIPKQHCAVFEHRLRFYLRSFISILTTEDALLISERFLFW